MQRSDFAYELPPELIAQAPLPERTDSRMLVLETAGAAGRSSGPDLPRIQDSTVRELPRLVQPGDLLVLNDTRVVAARLLGTKPSGGRVEVFLERALDGGEALVQLRASKPIREGLEIGTPGGRVRVIGREGELWRIAVPAPALEFFERWGAVPLPPYIERSPEPGDRERYQSVFARELGAVAAPTASLHLSSLLMREIEARGAAHAFVTLHVGAGTFQPVRTEDLEAHTMHAERVSISAETCEAVERARAAGGRVVAVGTTVVRALESAALVSAHAESSEAGSAPGASGGAAPLRVRLPAGGWRGETRLFIRPGYRFRVVDALLTNFHLPESTLLMLVCAFAGREAVLHAYRHAVQARYRFFSYGDCMFLTSRRAAT